MLRDTRRNRKPVRTKRRSRFRITRLEDRIAPTHVCDGAGKCEGHGGPGRGGGGPPH